MRTTINSWPIDLPGRQEIIAKLKIYELILIIVFIGLSTLTSYLLWTIVNWRVAVQIAIIMIVAVAGEHYISGQGYYYYTKSKHNSFFIGRVPLWIPFMWVFVVQGAFIISLMLGISAAVAVITSGLLCFLLDLIVIEPVLSRERSLWAWTPVDKGYLGFLPLQLDRFTAPPGNYLVWFIFPIITNWILCGLVIFFTG